MNQTQRVPQLPHRVVRHLDRLAPGQDFLRRQLIPAGSSSCGSSAVNFDRKTHHRPVIYLKFYKCIDIYIMMYIYICNYRAYKVQDFKMLQVPLLLKDPVFSSILSISVVYAKTLNGLERRSGCRSVRPLD